MFSPTNKFKKLYNILSRVLHCQDYIKELLLLKQDTRLEIVKCLAAVMDIVYCPKIAYEFDITAIDVPPSQIKFLREKWAESHGQLTRSELLEKNFYA